MRLVQSAGAGPVSALGFGCASLGSRIAPRAGRAAIERALAAGVTWFDVAPSYGAGKAEEILGRALRGTNASIATKVGLVAPPGNPLKRAISAVSRPVLGAIPALRPLAKRLNAGAAQRLPLDAETVRISLYQSLERLGCDSVAMLALHDPSLEDIRDEGVIAAICDLKDQGLAAQIAIAGSVEVCVAALDAGLPVDVAQVANSPFNRNLNRIAGRVPFTIVHSVFGVAGALDAMKRFLKSPEARGMVAQLGYDDAAQLLLDYAFAANPNGVVIASSYSAAHLAANAAAASRVPDADLVRRVDEMVAGLGGL
jgi:aryl-alcohol dehydrogenase-like predicted oxidoreductase